MMRGDVKWPPEETRQRMLDEKTEQEIIAAGPAQRPKKVKKVRKNLPSIAREKKQL